MATPKQHSTPQEAKEAFLEQLQEAVSEGKWMGVVFSVDPNDSNKIIIRRTTSEFPNTEFNTCVDLLSENLQQEIVRSFPNREPLPLAEHAKDSRRTSEDEVREMFGGDG